MYQRIIRRCRADQGWLWILLLVFLLKWRIHTVQRKSVINYSADGLLWIKGSGFCYQSPYTVSMVHLTRSYKLVGQWKDWLGPCSVQLDNAIDSWGYQGQFYDHTWHSSEVPYILFLFMENFFMNFTNFGDSCENEIVNFPQFHSLQLTSRK